MSLQQDELVMPYLRALSVFRDGVRRLAIGKRETALQDILALSDQLRDVDLVPLGVALDDQDGAVQLLYGVCATDRTRSQMGGRW